MTERSGPAPRRARGAHFSFQIGNYTFEGVPEQDTFEHISACVLEAERVGFDDVFLVDHFQQVWSNGPPENAMLEPYVTLGAIAARTSTVKLGTLVTGVTYRNPALLAKAITSLDVISKGRAVLGIGAGWNDEEHRAYGFPFPPLAERFERLEEAVQVCRLMFTQPRASFAGRHYTVDGALNHPRPIQAGGPSILIGGSGEKKTLRLVARHADMCSFLGGGLDEVRRKLDVLEQHCHAEGRDPSEIVKLSSVNVVVARDRATAVAESERLVRRRAEGARRMNLALSDDAIRGSAVVGDPELVAEGLARYLELGLDGFAVHNFSFPTPASIGPMADVIRLLRS